MDTGTVGTRPTSLMNIALVVRLLLLNPTRTNPMGFPKVTMGTSGMLINRSILGIFPTLSTQKVLAGSGKTDPPERL